MDYNLYTFWKHKTLDNFLFQLVGLHISEKRRVFKLIKTQHYSINCNNCHSGTNSAFLYDEKGQSIYHTKENIVSYKFFDLNDMIEHDEFNTPFNTKYIDKILNIIDVYT